MRGPEGPTVKNKKVVLPGLLLKVQTYLKYATSRLPRLAVTFWVLFYNLGPLAGVTPYWATARVLQTHLDDCEEKPKRGACNQQGSHLNWGECS